MLEGLEVFLYGLFCSLYVYVIRLWPIVVLLALVGAAIGYRKARQANVTQGEGLLGAVIGLVVGWVIGHILFAIVFLLTGGCSQ